MNNQPIEVWTAKEISALLGLSERHVAERVVHEPGFPAPIRPGKHQRKRWLREVIEEWLRRQA